MSAFAIDHPWAWSLPLDAASPWSARLAMVAAWMVSGRSEFASIHQHLSDLIVLASWRGPWQEPERWTWTGRGWAAASPFPLPTLPAHLANHPPAVALILALYDVPEIRARVEAL